MSSKYVDYRSLLLPRSEGYSPEVGHMLMNPARNGNWPPYTRIFQTGTAASATNTATSHQAASNAAAVGTLP